MSISNYITRINPTLLRWLDLPTLTLFIIFTYSILKIPLTDPDYFWHLKTGEYILTHWQIPPHDIFSYTKEGEPWLLNAWLFEAMLFSTHHYLGDFGVRAFTALISTLTLLVIYKSTLLHCKHKTLAIALTILAFSICTGFLTPRPHLFSILFTAIYLHILFEYKYHDSIKYLWTLPIIMILWVNLHGGFILGMAILFAFCATEHIQQIFTDKKDNNSHLKWLWGCLLLVMTFSLINPDHIGRLIYATGFFNSLEFSIQNITEWASPDFHLLFFKYYFFLIGGFVLIYIYGSRKPDLTELVIPACFIFMSFVHLRYMPFAIIAMVLFSAVFFQGLSLNRIPQKLESIKNKTIGHKTINKDLGDTEFILNWAILFFIVIGSGMSYSYMAKKHEDMRHTLYPVEATNFVIEHNITGKLFNEYGPGGYLLYRLYPSRKVFIDPRTDMYGDEFYQKNLELVYLLPGWREYFNKFNFDYLILSNQIMPLHQLLLFKNEYGLAYKDENFSVLLARNDKHNAIISRYDETINANDGELKQGSQSH